MNDQEMNKHHKIIKINIFNKFILFTVLFLLIIACFIKIHSIMSFPKIDKWNYQQLQKIDKTKNDFEFIRSSEFMWKVKT